MRILLLDFRLDGGSLKFLKSIGPRLGTFGSRLNVCILVNLGLLRGCRANVDCFVPAGK